MFNNSLSYADYIPREDKQRQLSIYKADIEKFESIIAANNKIISDLTLRQKNINNQIKILSELIENIKSGGSPNKYLKQEAEFISKKEKIEKLKDEFKKRILWLYKKGADYEYQILFTSESPAKFYARLEYLNKLSESRKSDFETIKYEELAFLESKKILGLNKSELSKYIAQRKQDQTKLLLEKTNIEDSLSTLKSTVENYYYHIEKYRSKIADLEFILSTTYEITKYKLKIKPDYSSDNFENLKGVLLFPVNSTDIFNDFGKSTDPATGTIVNNEGIDVSISDNSEVRCVADGIVENIVDIPLYRKIVIIRHKNSFRTIYGIVKNVTVNINDIIPAGKVIAYTSQNNEGQLFHFEIRKGIKPEDPKYWVARIN